MTFKFLIINIPPEHCLNLSRNASWKTSYSLETPSPAMNSSALVTPAPAIKTMIIYYMAPWQALTGGGTPSNVYSKICTI